MASTSSSVRPSDRTLPPLLGALAAWLLVGVAAAQEPFQLGTWARPVPRHSVLAEPGFYVWGGSVVEDGGSYHMFYSRWPTSPWTFGDGWLFASEIAHAVAPTPDGPFVPTGVVLGRRANDPTLAFWDSQTQHNPHIRKFGTKFYLYYMASADPGATVWPGITQRNRIQRNQRIGVIVADTMQDLVSGNWTRPSAPIVTPVYSTSAATDRTTNPIDYASNRIVNNQTVIQRPDGFYQLIYKSNWPQAPGYGHGYALALDPAGPFTQMTPPIFSDQGREDENHWYDAVRGRYYLLCKNFAGGGTEQLESADSVSWTSRGIQLPRTIRWADGVTEPIEALERPQVLRNAAGEPVMLYMAARRALGGGVVEAFNVHIPLAPPAVRATALTSAAEIATSGALVSAVNLGATTPVTVGGLTFAASGASPGTLASVYGFRQAGGSAGAVLNAGLVDTVYAGLPEFEDFLDTMVWQSATPVTGATLAFDLATLVPGHSYRLQLFFAESRTTPSRHGPQELSIGGHTATFDFGPTSSLVAPGATAVRLEAHFTATAASMPVTLTQLIAGGGGLQLSAFALHDVSANVAPAGSGCASSGGGNTLVATTLPLIAATFRAAATGLPTIGIAFAVSSFAPQVPPQPLATLIPQGVGGCHLHVAPDVLELLLPWNGTAHSALALPALPALVGVEVFHQVVPIELDAAANLVAVTSTNALRLTIGLF